MGLFTKKPRNKAEEDASALIKEQDHKGLIHRNKYGSTRKLKKYTCAAFGGSSFSSGGDCKYKHPNEFDKFMMDYPEYHVLSISQEKCHDSKILYTVWMVLKREDTRFLENL